MAENKTKTPPKGNIRFSIGLSDEQKSAKAEILKHPFNFIIGKAGSGKTLLACQISLDMFFKRKVNKIVITRPTVSTEDNGFLPGSLEEKLEPWLVPIRSNMRKVYNKPDILNKMESQENIELVPLTHFRGRTLDDSAIHEVPKLKGCRWVYDIILMDNHRHEALDEVLRLLNDY